MSCCRVDLAQNKKESHFFVSEIAAVPLNLHMQIINSRYKVSILKEVDIWY